MLCFFVQSDKFKRTDHNDGIIRNSDGGDYFANQHAVPHLLCFPGPMHVPTHSSDMYIYINEPILNSINTHILPTVMHIL